MVAVAGPALGTEGASGFVTPLDAALARCASFAPANAEHVPAGRTLSFAADTRIEHPTVRVEGILATETLRNPPAGDSAPRAADLCIITERLTVGPEGKVATGDGVTATTQVEDAVDGRYNGLHGGRGGDLIVILRDDPNTPALPMLSLAGAAKLVTGAGGDGKSVHFRDIPVDLCYIVDEAVGGDGGDSGALDLHAPAFVFNGNFANTLTLGKGGNGGDALGLTASDSGRGGHSRALINGAEPSASTAGFFSASEGGSGGRAIANPDLYVYEMCTACVWLYGGDLLSCILPGDQGADIQKCPKPPAPPTTVTARGKDGGYGVIRGGKGGDAIAEACVPIGTAYSPPPPGTCSPFSNGPKSADGGPGPGGHSASATAGNGGDSIVEGGNGGNSQATASDGFAGGHGAPGCDQFPVNVVCWAGGHGGDGGNGGHGGSATSLAGKGGGATLGPKGADGTYKGKAGLGGAGGAPGLGGAGTTTVTTPWPYPPYFVFLPCIPPINGNAGAAGDKGDDGSLREGVRG